MNRTWTRIQRWGALFLFLVLLGGSIAWRVGQVRAKQAEQAKQRTAARGRTPTVAVAPVVRQTLEEAVEELVSLRAPLNVNVASKVSGRILTLKHFEGDSVRAGEELILIDPEELEAHVREVRAALRAAERRLQQARIGEQPQRSQVTAGIEQAQTELDTARAELRQAEASVGSKLANAKSAVAQTKARLDNEELQLRRLEQLLTRGFVPAQDVDSGRMRVAVARADQDSANERVTLTEAENRAALDVARESVKRAEARVKVARANQAQNPMYMQQIASLQASADEQRAALENAVAALGQTRIVAPISGFVTSRLMDPGAMATPGQAILTIVDIRTIWAEASLSEEQAGRIRPGSPGEVSLDGIPGRKFQGRVIQVNPAANVQSRAFTVRVELSNPELLLKPGMFGRVRFVVSRNAGALTIPSEAVLDSPNGEHNVFVVDEDTAHRVPVTVRSSRNGITEIRGGLTEGQWVITMGYERLRDGAQVRRGPAREKPWSASFSVRRPVAVAMAMLVVVLLGGVCAMRLPIDLLPDVSFPQVTVRTVWPNVSPEEMELMVTRPLEQAVSSATNLYRVTSTSYMGQSQVRVEFNYGVDMDLAAVEVLQLVERATDRLPDDPTRKTPVVYKYNPNDFPIMRFGVSAPGSEVRLRSMVDELIVPRLESVNGVGSAEVVGGLRREIRVEVDLEKLRARNLTLADITRRLGQENANIPGGLAREGNTELAIRSLGLFDAPSDIEHVVLTSYQGQAVYVRDVARVVDDKEEPRAMTRLNGQPSVGIWVRKQSAANTVETANGIRREIDLLKKDYPEIAWGVTSNYAGFIETAVHHTENEALVGAILAVFVILFFLRNVRSTLVIGLSIPISLCATFALLYLCGFTLNVMSLSGIALAVGLIVDDAIVVLENIYRHVERDRKPPREAAVSATNEVATAVVASTVTVMVVFLPLLFVRGVAGQMYTQLALTIVFAIAMSLIMAMTLVPMFASRMLRGGGERPSGRLAGAFYDWAGRRFHALDEGYRELLRWALNHRGLTVLIAMATLGASLLLYPMIGTELMPPSDNGDFRVSVKMPVGTALHVTDRVSVAMEEKLRKIRGVQTVFGTVGTSGFDNRPQPNQGQTTVRMASGEAAGGRERPTADAMREARKLLGGVPGANVNINQFDLVARVITGGDELELRIFGNDPATLVRVGRQVIDEVKTIPGLGNPDLSWQASTPELRIVVDRQKAASLGLSFSDIANTIDTATGGSVATYFEEGGFSYPVRVQLRGEQRRTVESLGRIVLRAGQTQLTSQIALPRGQWIRLNQVARIDVAEGPSEISRLNRERYISVKGTPVDRPLGDLVKEIDQRLPRIKLPAGYRFQWGGAQEQMSRNFGDLALAVVLAVALIYMVLAAQFESFVHPLTIMLSVPLSIIGVLLALFLTGRSFGMTAYIGLLMLVGLVVKNSILLVDYTNVLREQGMERTAAVLRAGPTRLRPILMTSGCAVLGMLPLALGLGKGTETQAPMATAVIGGLITSTMLTLLVIPVVYTLLDDIIRRSRPSRPQPVDVHETAPMEEREPADPRREVPGYRFQAQGE